MRRSMQDLVHFTRENGLSMSQFSTILRLHHEGDCGVSDLGEHLGVTNAAASQLVDKLVQQGYVERCEDPQDRRNKILSLTQRGLHLAQESLEVRQRWQSTLVEALSPQEQEQISAALNRLTQAARALNHHQDKFIDH